MKNLTYLFAVLFSVSTLAAGPFDGKSKEELGQYEIQVLDKKTGRVIGKMSRAEYKVVKIEEQEASSPKVEDKTKTKPKHLVILHAGVGKDGLRSDHPGSSHRVSERDAPIGGVTLCRTTDGPGICASAFTNKTFTLGVKFDL